MPDYVIIVAGGKGKRMGNGLPKQFMEINGIPMLMHTIRLFYRTDSSLQFIIVLPASHISTWRQLCKTHAFDIKHLIAEGGPERFHSVKSGLKLVKDDASLVAVHDAVRPLVRPEVITNIFSTAARSGNAVPAVPVRDSVREWDGPYNKPIDRSKLFLVQTPQCFIASVLKKAYLQNYREDFTDDATVVESMGEKIHLVAGNTENIKITTPGDMGFAEAILKSNS